MCRECEANRAPPGARLRSPEWVPLSFCLRRLRQLKGQKNYPRGSKDAEGTSAIMGNVIGSGDQSTAVETADLARDVWSAGGEKAEKIVDVSGRAEAIQGNTLEIPPLLILRI